MDEKRIASYYFKEYAKMIISVSIGGLIILSLFMVIHPILAYVGFIIIQLYLLYELFDSMEEMILHISGK